MPRPPYPTDGSDAEWAVWAPLVPAPLRGGRSPATPAARSSTASWTCCARGVIGVPCRMTCRRGGTFWWSCRPWREDGVWETINTALRERVRMRCGREPTPSTAILASQTVKTTEQGAVWRRPGQANDRPHAP